MKHQITVWFVGDNPADALGSLVFDDPECAEESDLFHNGIICHFNNSSRTQGKLKKLSFTKGILRCQQPLSKIGSGAIIKVLPR